MGIDFSLRRDKVRERCKEEGIDNLLITYAANRYYVSGFELHDPQCNETSGWILVRENGEDWLMTDPRYEEAAKALWPRDRIFLYKGKRDEKVTGFLRELGIQSLGFEPNAMNVATYTKFLETVEMTPARHVVEKVRKIKEPEEIERLRASCNLNHEVMQWVEEDLVHRGWDEATMAWEIEKKFRESGAREMAFPSIVGVGTNAALPHAVPGGRKAEDEDLILVDTGARYRDYCSDQTRTFWAGERPDERFFYVRELVQSAQNRAIEKLKPGMELKEVYHLARDVFVKEGVEAYFTHGLGHGIGLETHEAPSISPVAEGTLEPGMVVTVEPGLYYPDWGGVRWEYMILVTEKGAEIL